MGATVGAEGREAVMLGMLWVAFGFLVARAALEGEGV